MKFLQDIQKDGYLKTIIALFSLAFLPQIFVHIGDANLIATFETDPGSIIMSIEDLFKGPIYNMHNGYHSKFYGWTYLSINFFLLLPLKLAFKLFHIKNDETFYMSIRLILFLIGLASSIVFFKITSRIFNKNLGLIATFFYILCPSYYFFYFIHPETTGLLFTFLEIFFLLKYQENYKEFNYIKIIVFCTLACLSKQTFLFTSIAIIGVFIYLFCKNIKNHSFSQKEFKKIAIYSITTSFLTLLIIHPFSIIEIKNFISYQSHLLSVFNNDNLPTFSQNIALWKDLIIKESPIITISIALYPLTILFSAYEYKKTKNQLNIIYIISITSAILILLITINSNRLFHSTYYLFPCYPFFLINIFAIINRTLKIKKWKFKQALTFIIVYFLILYGLISIKNSFPNLVERLDYKKSLSYKTNEFISSNLSENDKLAYDHQTGFKKSLNIKSCHYWQGCGVQKNLEEFNPNYIIFNEELTVNSKIPEGTGVLKEYVLKNKMKKIAQISGTYNNIVDLDISKNKDNKVTVSVYKK